MQEAPERADFLHAVLCQVGIVGGGVNPRFSGA
jgi:hypothetical protein